MVDAWVGLFLGKGSRVNFKMVFSLQPEKRIYFQDPQSSVENFWINLMSIKFHGCVSLLRSAFYQNFRLTNQLFVTYHLPRKKINYLYTRTGWCHCQVTNYVDSKFFPISWLSMWIPIHLIQAIALCQNNLLLAVLPSRLIPPCCPLNGRDLVCWAILLLFVSLMEASFQWDSPKRLLIETQRLDQMF